MFGSILRALFAGSGKQNVERCSHVYDDPNSTAFERGKAKARVRLTFLVDPIGTTTALAKRVKEEYRRANDR